MHYKYIKIVKPFNLSDPPVKDGGLKIVLLKSFTQEINETRRSDKHKNNITCHSNSH